MPGLAIWQDNHAQESALHFWHLNPTPDTTVSLHRFPNWRPDGPLDPFVSDDLTIRSLPDRLKVARNFHNISVSDFHFAS